MRRAAVGLLLAAALVALLADWYSPLGQQQLRAQAPARPSPAPGPLPHNLLWMLQISDLHISLFSEPKRATEFEKFCTETVPVIQPALVLATGDLTDGKTKDNLGSDQLEAEWQIYQSILKRSKVMEKTKWIDIKGNHVISEEYFGFVRLLKQGLLRSIVNNTFNVPSLENVRNYYRKYSAWHKDGSFHHVHRTPFGKYSFICVDATLTPGPKRPYNFFGILNANQIQELSTLSAESYDSNHTIWFGHYPTSAILSPYPGIRTAMRSATAYLCGHFHTVGGMMPVLHTQHRHGTLELELGDWKKNRKYRILAIDHDLFSFADLNFEDWPVVLITNPKSFLYSSAAHEPLERILHSTHIRVLAFSPSPIKSVKVSIDGVELGDAVHVSGPLYVLKWNPQTYIRGFHKINVTVQDASGKTCTRLHIFAMEEKLSLRFNLLQSWALLTDHYIWIRVVFVLFVLVQIALLVTFRCLRHPKLDGPLNMRSWISVSLHILSKTNLFFYSFLLLSLYTVLGPWFIGEIIDGHIGICFSFGVIVNGRFYEGSITFFVGILQVLFFNFPLMAYVCWCLLLRCKGHSFRSHLRNLKLYQFVPVHFIMALFFCWHIFSCFFLWRTYGIMSFLVSPLRSWLIILTLLLLYGTWKLRSATLSAFIVKMKDYEYSE